MRSKYISMSKKNTKKNLFFFYAGSCLAPQSNAMDFLLAAHYYLLKRAQDLIVAGSNPCPFKLILFYWVCEFVREKKWRCYHWGY